MSDLFQARVSPEHKKRFYELQKSHDISAKKTMEMLFNAYDSIQTRESLKEHKELDLVQHHLKRLEEMFLSVVQSSKDEKEKNIEEITELKKEVADSIKKANKAEEELERKKYYYETQAEQAQKVVNQSQKLIDVYENEKKNSFKN